MPASSARRKSGPRRSAAKSRKPKQSPFALLRRGVQSVWYALPLIILLLVVLAALVVDPAAVVHLTWAGLTGGFGRTVQLGTAVSVIAVTGLIAWAFWPETSPVPQPRRASARVNQRRTQPTQKQSPPASASRPPRRRRSAGAQAEQCEPDTTAPASDATAATAVVDARTEQPAPGGRRRRAARATAREHRSSGSRPPAAVWQDDTG